MEQALSWAFSSTAAQLCADVLTTEKNMAYTKITMTQCGHGKRPCIYELEVQWRQKSIMAGLTEEPASPIKFRVEKIVWQIPILDIDQGKCVLPVL